MRKMIAWGSVFFFVFFVPYTLWAFCGPPNLLIVLDRSGSMNNANKWKDAKSAINQVTASYSSKIRFGLETFSDSATINAKIPSTASTISTAMNRISPLGQTFMVKAMITARSHLIAVLNADKNAGRPTQILFITDGEPSDRCPGTEVSGLRKVTVKGKLYEIKTYVIGFGSLVNRVCLNDLAVKGGTALPGSIRYYVANNASGLVSAMKRIITSATQSATREVCDNKDNDCDGKVDESLRRTCYKLKCRGYETCSKGKWGACSAASPKTETCDGKDNDCDGKVDEDLKRACSNQCGRGTESCSRGRWVSCNATTTRTCKNQCGTGKQLCRNNRWYACTPSPKREVCDGKDNDCDGKTDEDLFRDCLPCGRQQCRSGRWGTCVKGTPKKEECNNKDDDCNGKVDEFTKPCTNKCGTGTQLCRRGRWYSCTARKTNERCDNKDNDCDGKIDEDLRRSCGTCAIQTCSRGRWGACVKGTKGTEVCDNKDNDCDGKIDEDVKKTCRYRNCQGEQLCSRGRWTSCRPPVEKCDGKDNDCDGRVDENWSQKGKPCGTGLGICYRTGLFSCSRDGKGLICNVKPGPSAKEIAMRRTTIVTVLAMKA